MLESAADKDKILRTKITSIGNIVHDSVPISNNEVCQELLNVLLSYFANRMARHFRTTMRCSEPGLPTA